MTFGKRGVALPVAVLALAFPISAIACDGTGDDSSDQQTATTFSRQSSFGKDCGRHRHHHARHHACARWSDRDDD